jgi:hypothetical protein
MFNFFIKLLNGKSSQNINVEKISGSAKVDITTIEKLEMIHLDDESLKKLMDKLSNKFGFTSLSLEKLTYSKDIIPQLSSNISKRENTIKELLENCSKNWIAINGMYDTGKTQLSVLIKEFLNCNTIWISFKECNEQIFIKKLCSSFEVTNEDELILKIEEFDPLEKTLLVLDDLPKFGEFEAVINFFNLFISKCLNKNIFILSTSNFVIHSKIKSIHIDTFEEIKMPLLTELECDEIISTYPLSKDFAYKNIIYTMTQGYPIYLQVVCRYLENNNWNIEESELHGFITGSIFTDLTEETISKLLLKIQDEDTRELLYRLNIVKTNVTEREIKIISECVPYISKPFEKINSISGTWIQKQNVNSYNVSPLIKMLGTKDLEKEVFFEINYKLGKSILDKKNISQFEVQYVISYFKSAEKFDELGIFMLHFMRNMISKIDYFFEWNFDFYCWYYENLPDKMPLIFRLLIRGFHLNIEFNRKEKEKTHLSFLRNDLELLVEEALNNKIDVYFPSLILSSSYLSDDSFKALKYFTYYRNSYTFKQLPLSSPEKNEHIAIDNSMIWVLLANINDIDSLNEWFDNYENFPKNNTEHDLEQIYIFIENLFLNFILKEENNSVPNWNSLIEIFKSIFEKANLLSIELLKAFSVKKQIFVISNKLNDINLAEQIYLEHSSEFKTDLAYFLITDELGRQFFYKGFRDKSLDLLSKISDINVEDFVSIKMDTYLTLAKLQDNEFTAHSHMESALMFSKENKYIDEINNIKFIGEFAISLYLISDFYNSMINFIDGYEMLLNSFEDNKDYKSTQVRYGNSLFYIYSIIETGEPPISGYTVPYRGFFTNENDLSNLYYQEKLLIIIFNIIRFFEINDNKAKSIYWVEKLFDLKKKYGLKIFNRMLTPLLGYKIIENKYEEAINIEIEIFQNLKELVNTDSSQIKNEEEMKLISSIQQREINIDQTNEDFDLFIQVFNPIIFHLINRLLKKEINSSTFKLIGKQIFNSHAKNIHNKKSLFYIDYFFNNFPSSYYESQQLMEYINNIESDEVRDIQSIGYLICSFEMKSIVAIEAHLSFKEIFNLYFGSINNYIIVPFLLEFWRNKIIKEPNSFKNIQKVKENLSKITNLKKQLQVKAIFCIISESLNYKFNSNEIEWAKEYYEEYE